MNSTPDAPASVGADGLFTRPPTVAAMQPPLDASWNQAPPGNPADLSALVDFAPMSAIFEDFLEVVGLPVAIIDLDGRVLASSRWQRLCMEFHRALPRTLARCLESDTSLSCDMAKGKDYALYRCRNGLTDCATPLVIDGEHVANLFVGQFLLAPPDEAYFEAQCGEFGFARDGYMKALAEVPIVAEERLPSIARLMGGLARQIVRMALAEKRALAAHAAVERQVVERTRELAASTDRLRKIADRVPGVVFQFMRRADGSMCVPYASDVAIDIFGFPPEAVKDDARKVFKSIHPDDLAPMLASIEKSAGDLSPWRHEFRICRQDGSWIWGLGDALPERMEDGAILWHGFITDDTGPHRTRDLLEARLRLAEKSSTCSLHDLLVATLDEACALTEAKTGFFHFLQDDQVTLSLQAWSSAATAHCCTATPESPQYDLDKAGGWADCIRQRRSIIYNEYAAPLHRKGLPEGHAEMVRMLSVPIFREGRIRAIIGLGNKSRDFDESDLRTVEILNGMAWDLAERKRAEVEGAEHARRLVRSNADLEQFAYVVSHDLRQPLRMVTSYLTLIERRYADKLDADGHEFIGFARDGAKQMDRLILDLLEYSRVGRHGREPEPVNVALAVDEACRQLEVLIAETGAVMRVAKGEDFTLVARRHEIVRLFQNIIGNAIKYRSPLRVPEIEVSWERQEGAWLVRVADNGIGIAPEYQDEIFKIFRRLHTSDQYEGTGIGLAICQKIVTTLGGRIWVESEPGRGTAFLFTFPAA